MCGKAAEDARRRADRDERQRIAALPGVVAAQYSGVCGKCGQWHHVGELIQPQREGRMTSWVAECCL
jgi:hypothetical protein